MRKKKHVQVKHSVEDESSAEESDKTYDDSIVRVVDNKEDAGRDAREPNHNNNGYGALGGHDAVVAQRVKDSNVTVSRDCTQKRQGRHHGAADHYINNVVQVTQHPWMHVQQSVVVEQHKDGLYHIADTDQHVRHCQTANEVVHGRM